MKFMLGCYGGGAEGAWPSAEIIAAGRKQPKTDQKKGGDNKD